MTEMLQIASSFLANGGQIKKLPPSKKTVKTFVNTRGSIAFRGSRSNSLRNQGFSKAK